MASFCGNCGAPLDDASRVCGQCGTPVPGAQAPVPPQGAPVTAKNKKDTKIIALVVAAIIAIVAIVIIANVASNFTGYKGAIRKMVKALQNDDVDALETMASAISDEQYEAWYGNKFYDEYDDAIKDTLDKYEDSVGNIKKISFEITDEMEVSDRRIDDLKDELEEKYNMDTSGIKKIMNVELKITVKGSKKSSVYNVHDLYLIKEDGGWKFYYGNLF